MKKRLLSLVLCLVMVFSLFPAFGMNAAAAETVVDSKSVEKNMLHLDKTLSVNDDGTYNIKLESYAKGVSKTTQVTEAIPTDFVLVLDQSGSMYKQDIPTGYRVAGSTWHPNDFLNVTVIDSGSRNNSMSVTSNTYYYNVPGTNEYYEVYYKDRPSSSFQTIPTNEGILDYTTYENFIAGQIGGHCYEYGQNDSRYSSHMEPVYYKDSDGTYYRVYTYSEGLTLRYHCTLFYYDSLGVRHDLGTYTYTTLSILNNTVTGTFYTNNYYTRSGNFWNYQYTQHYIQHGYKPYYKDADGVEHQLPGSLSVDGEGDVFYNGVLYEKNSNVTRVSALESAVSNFVDLVNEQAMDNNVNHKVAVIGFSDHYGDADNTELLSTGTLTTRSAYNYSNDYQLFPYGYNYNGPEHNGSSTVGGAGGISVPDYQAALQDATTAEGVATLKQAAHAVTACGGTEPEFGFYMAENVLKNRTEKTYTDAAGQTQKRNTVVIFFTDGHPGMYDSSDQIAAANKVVTAANRLKTEAEFNYTKVYSVGVFDGGDDQPLTFAVTDEIDNRDNYLYQSDGYYYLRGNTVATTNHNDTIKDYMECVSSEYPNAVNFLNHNGTSDSGTSAHNRGSATSDDKTYYMKVTDTDGLKRAFENALIDVDSTTTEVVAGTHSEFQDVINQEDFEIPSTARATAYSVDFNTTDGVNYTQGTTHRDDYGNVPIVDGKVTVSGFDYSTYYASVGKTDGRKLIVEITGLLPADVGDVYSNSSTTIKPDTEKEPDLVALSLPESPKDTVGEKTYIIDFGAEMIVANNAGNVKQLARADGKSNGTFNLDGGKAVYQLKSKDAAGKFNVSFSGVDNAMIFGEPVGVDSTRRTWNKITAVPANNIYFDDQLGTLTVEDGSGKNSGVLNASSMGNTGTTNVNAPYGSPIEFTFTGSRIDIYCTTASDSGAVIAQVYDKDQNLKKEYNTVVTNRFDGKDENNNPITLYNVPTVSFTMDSVDTYTVKIYTNDSSKYKLDGVRVYKAASETNTDVKNAYLDAGEANSFFLNVREQLLNGANVTAINDYLWAKRQYDYAEDKTGMTEPVPPAAETIKGVMFYMDSESTAGTDKLKMTADYSKYGPKNEVYLAKNEGLAFSVANAPDDMKVWIGLSAPEGHDGVVYINGAKTEIKSNVDMYYLVPDVAEGDSISIENKDDPNDPNDANALISVTNVKITGSKLNGEPGATVLSVADADSAARALSAEDGQPYLTVTQQMLAELNAPEQAEDPQPTADPEPTPTQPGIAEWIANLFSSFVNALFGSIARLFGN